MYSTATAKSSAELQEVPAGHLAHEPSEKLLRPGPTRAPLPDFSCRLECQTQYEFLCMVWFISRIPLSGGPWSVRVAVLH
jgi:hypothetical protein